jgi:hypothetical protein
MKRIGIILVFCLLSRFSWAEGKYQTYNGMVYNFINADEEGKKSEFIIRNADKILDSVNSGRTGKNRYFIIQYIFGNFTNSRKTEVVVFFNREEYRRESFFGISTMRLYIFDENENIIKECGIDKYVVSILKKQQLYECPPLGKTYSEGWVCDLNGNGKQELIFFHGDAMFDTMCILEYSDGELKNLLEFKDENTKVLDADLGKHTIYFERQTWDKIEKKYKLIKTKAVWDEEKNMYIEKIIE